MANTVTVYNSKGGQGKTTLAVLYALFSISHYYTNDYKSGSEALYKELITPGFFHVIKPDDKELDSHSKMVFDFGGFIDGRIPDVLKASGLCLVPVMYQSNADLKALFIIIDVISKINNNIAIVINNTKTKDVEPLKEAIEAVYKGRYPVKVINQSAYMTYLANEGKTPFELQGLGAAQKSLIGVQEQLKALFTFMMEY